MLKVPHLKTALTVPLLDLEKKCLDQQNSIEHWFRLKWHENRAPFYGSVDLRNSGFKLTPVDMNLFPGGFNNVNPSFIPLAVHAVKSLLDKYTYQARKFLLIPENHSRNQAYLHNVYTLIQIFRQAGVEIQVGSLSEEITEITEVTLNDGKKITYHPIKREGNLIKTSSGYTPCCLILNNDLSSGRPAILENLDQSLSPPLNAGWYMRKKTNFFTEYDKVCDEFGQLIGIDPWQINAFFDIATGLDFASRTGIEELASKVDTMLEKIRVKYKEHNISEDPYVIVKANNGTYGMGIMVVRSSEDILSINRKERNKMAVIKDGQSVSEVIIQEGVHTFEEVDGSVAEPVVYMVDNSVIGGFYRVHPKKGKDENLNAVGANFIPLTFASPCISEFGGEPDCPPNRFYTYGVIARLALLASSMELATYI